MSRFESLDRGFRPLASVRVLDFGRLMPSGIATAELARLGADVVKIEAPPHGDYLRVNPPLIRGRGDMHLDLNRGKRSLAIRLETEGGQELLRELADQVDVIVELSRPGVMQRFGLDEEALRSRNSALIYASFSAFGQNGPYSALPAHGLSADAASGFLPQSSVEGERVLPDPYVSVGPRAAGLYGATAICAALFQRSRSGSGCYIDISQADAAVAWNYRDLAMQSNLNEPTPSYRDLGPRYDIYRCADGRYVLFAASEPKFWDAFCDGVARWDLKVHSGTTPVVFGDNPTLREELVSIIEARSRDEWVNFSRDHGVPIAPVLEPREVRSNAHFAARHMVLNERHPLGGDVYLSGFPIKSDSSVAVALEPAPELGEHTEVILKEFGVSEDRISDYLSRGTAIQYRPREM